MGRFSDLFGNSANAQATARAAEWETALGRNDLPGFVKERLRETAEKRRPWVSTSAPGSLLAQRLRGVRPVGMVSGNCWFHYGYSWTEGHYQGWKTAIERLWQEAVLMGANAVVDVTMRIRRMPGPENIEHMDYGVVGTAVRLDGLPESINPAVATVSALEFLRLLEAGIVPVGVAIGAQYDWLTLGTGLNMNMAPFGMNAPGMGMGNMGANGPMGVGSWWNQEWVALSKLAERVRRQAIGQMRDDGLRIGSGVLGQTQHSELLNFPADQENPYPRFLMRHIAIGTAILHDGRAVKPLGVVPVINAGNDGRLIPRNKSKGVI
ncbi:MAG: heavy metal-binding domain-containing protein [Gammaproteobacteria bacterium]|nr:heavy metal-binding domain-containing protein [Gammaproteobacteria bacterium]